jgi:UDP-N-acetylmuramoylalanine--D-glutamate ligase
MKNAKHHVFGNRVVEYIHLVDLEKQSCLQGTHNVQNVNVAIASALHLSVPMEHIMKGIQSFKGLSHRMEMVMRSKDDLISIINDSKATNADAAERALACYLDSEIFWIAGGKAKDNGIESLSGYFQKIKKIYTIGDATQDFADCIGDQSSVECCYTLDAAVRSAVFDAKSSTTKLKKVILFSPACASFDQFQNFEHRGNVFKSMISTHFHE